MAEIFYENFAGTVGNSIITQNTTDFNPVSGGTGSTITYDDSRTLYVGNAGKVVTTSSYAIMEVPTFTAASLLYTTFYFQMDTLPGANAHVAEFHSNSGVETISQVRVSTSGIITLRDEYTAETWTGGPTLSVDTTYRICHWIDTTGGTDYHGIKVYLGNDQAAIDETQWVLGNPTTRTADTYYLGQVQAAGTLTAWFDEVHIDTATEWKPPVSESPTSYTRHIIIGQ